MPKHDLFLSHATEDKGDVVWPITVSLWAKGVIDIWIDEVALEPSKSIRKGIEQGLVDSSYIVAILTPSYFNKHWTELEFDSAITLQSRIIPIWHNVSSKDVKKFSPMLASIKGLRFSDGPDQIAERIVTLLERDKKSPYFKKADLRKERELFWYMARCYVQKAIGILDKELEDYLNSIELPTGVPTWYHHCMQQLGLTQNEILSLRNGFTTPLTDREAVTAMMTIFKERSGAWAPPEPGSKELAERMSSKKPPT
jgi:hypothetical protein